MNLPVGSSRCWLRALTLAALAAFFTTGCETYQQKNLTYHYWQRGDLTNAVVEATRQAEAHTNTVDAVIWRLEQATVLRALGNFEASNQAFDQAQEKMDDYAQQAKVSVTRQTGALLSNQANLPYRGRAYDGVMLNTYKALNYLALGETEKARPELIRAYQRQQEALADKQRQIEIAQAELAEQNAEQRELVEKSQNDPQFQNSLSVIQKPLEHFPAYANFIHPFTVYLDGLFFLTHAASDSDLERARKSFEQLTELGVGGEFVKQELAAIQELHAGRPLPPTTYVIFETGGAPIREEIRIDIPLYLPELPYLGAAFPQLQFQPDFLPRLIIRAEDQQFTTVSVGSLDAVIANDFKAEFPGILTKTLLSTAIKATATHLAWQATRRRQPNGHLDDGGWAGMAVLISATIWQAANNIADTRTWSTLPKEFQIARIPTPTDRKLELTDDQGLKTVLTIAPGHINLIHVKSINTRAPLLISQFPLKTSP